MPHRLIVILERPPDNGHLTYRYLLRADVPVSRQAKFAKPSYVSPFQPMPPDTDPDLSDLQSGAVVEVVKSWTLDGTTALSVVLTELAAQQAAYQSAVTGDQTFSRYGSYFDGQKWVAQGG